jgi:Ca2+-binding EF-hand superfamily protein
LQQPRPAVLRLLTLTMTAPSISMRPRRLFDKLDTDKDGTLDVKELKGRLTQKEFTAADPDNDGTLSKDEYLAVVEKRFKAADPDNDGTVSAAEFKTATGRSLSQLLS